MTNVDTRDPAPVRQPRRWPKVLLALSLTANLAVLGAVVGAHLRDGHDMGMMPPADRSMLRDTGVGPFFEALPRDVRARMGQALRARTGGLGPDRAALAQDFREMMAALRADPYDPARLETVLTAQQQRIQARVDADRAVLLDEIAAMNPADRAAFADRLEMGFRHAMDRAPGPPPGAGRNR